MTPGDDSPDFKVRVDDDRAWHVGSEFAEYDATHAVAGALLAGAEKVEVERTDVVDEDDEGRTAHGG